MVSDQQLLLIRIMFQGVMLLCIFSTPLDVLYNPTVLLPAHLHRVFDQIFSLHQIGSVQAIAEPINMHFIAANI